MRVSERCPAWGSLQKRVWDLDPAMRLRTSTLASAPSAGPFRPCSSISRIADCWSALSWSSRANSAARRGSMCRAPIRAVSTGRRAFPRSLPAAAFAAEWCTGSPTRPARTSKTNPSAQDLGATIYHAPGVPLGLRLGNDGFTRPISSGEPIRICSDRHASESRSSRPTIAR